MMDFTQHQITKSGLKGNRSRYNSSTPPPAAHVSYAPELVGKRYGWVGIISPEKRWAKNWRHPRVLTQCVGCGAVQWTLLNTLQRGLSKGCQACSQPRQIPRWLGRRLTAAKQRCTNLNDPGYPNYGGRGIEFRFPSVLAAGLWIKENLGIPPREMEIDRIDNNSHYEPGNLRFVTHQKNVNNRRNTRTPDWDPRKWPYVRSVVARKLSQGMTREEIIQEARLAVKEKRKNWRIIAARLEFMTY